MKGFALPSYTLLDADQSSSPFLSRRVQPRNITPGVQTAIDPLHKWRPNLSNNTVYILSLVFMFQDKGCFS